MQSKIFLGEGDGSSYLFTGLDLNHFTDRLLWNDFSDVAGWRACERSRAAIVHWQSPNGRNTVWVQYDYRSVRIFFVLERDSKVIASASLDRSYFDRESSSDYSTVEIDDLGYDWEDAFRKRRIKALIPDLVSRKFRGTTEGTPITSEVLIEEILTYTRGELTRHDWGYTVFCKRGSRVRLYLDKNITAVRCRWGVILRGVKYKIDAREGGGLIPSKNYTFKYSKGGEKDILIGCGYPQFLKSVATFAVTNGGGHTFCMGDVTGYDIDLYSQMTTEFRKNALRGVFEKLYCE